MSTTSKKYFDEKFKDEIWREFLKSVNKAKSVADLKNVFEKVLTPNEIIMVEKRLGILHLLDNDFKYRDIEEIIDVMPWTISFVKKGYKKSVKKKNENKIFRRSAEESFLHKKNSIMPTYVGKGRWNRT